MHDFVDGIVTLILQQGELLITEKPLFVLPPRSTYPSCGVAFLILELF